MNFADFHFLRPYWLIGLLPLTGYLYVYFHRRLKQGSWSDVCDPELLGWLLVDKPVKRQNYQLLWIFLAGVIAIIALSGPSWDRAPVPVFRNQSALVLVLDLSKSMDANDLKPNRIARARFKITDILRQRKDGQSALIVYSGAAFVVTPLSNDIDTIIHQLNVLEPDLMPAPGNNTKAAFKLASKLFKQAGVQSGQVLLITDGGGKEPTALKAASELAKRGHQLFILGVGTKEGAPIPQSGGFVKDKNGAILIPKLNQSMLKKMSKAGNGIYQKMGSSNSDIQKLLSAINNSADTDVSKKAVSEVSQWKDYGPWFVLMIIPFAALAFRKGYIAIVLISVCAISPDTQAMSWDTLWENANQRGQSAFNNNQYDKAANHFESPRWKAASHYRSGDYNKATEILTEIAKTSDDFYNLGNAQAQQQQLDLALKSYQQALALDPEHEDAKYNKEAVEKALKQQQNQQQKQDQDKQSDENSDSSEQQEDQEADSGDQQNQEQQNKDSSQQQEQEQSSQTNSENSSEQQDQETLDNELDEDSDEKNESQVQNKPEDKVDEDASEQQSKQVQANDQQPLNELDQATEQWMRRIPDDPGRLLRRKFLYQYNRKNNPGIKQK